MLIQAFRLLLSKCVRKHKDLLSDQLQWYCILYKITEPEQAKLAKGMLKKIFNYASCKYHYKSNLNFLCSYSHQSYLQLINLCVCCLTRCPGHLSKWVFCKVNMKKTH